MDTSAVPFRSYPFEWWERGGAAVAARELYDHRADPGEGVNLADRPEHRGTVEALAGRLRAGWEAAAPR